MRPLINNLSNSITPPRLLLFAVTVIGLFALQRIWTFHAPFALSGRVFEAASFGGLVTSILATAVIVERAVEVVVMIFRDQQADVLADAESQAQAELQAKTQALTQASGNIAASQSQKSDALTVAQTAKEQWARVHAQNLVYTAETKEFALRVGFMFGLLVSLAGVRVLHQLVDWNAMKGVAGAPPPLSRIFILSDILVTASLLAGGSEGIHRMANVFTSFLDSTSNRIDQKAALPQPASPSRG